MHGRWVGSSVRTRVRCAASRFSSLYQQPSPVPYQYRPFRLERATIVADNAAAHRFIAHNLYIWPAHPAADPALWHARGSHIHFVFSHASDFQGEESDGDSSANFHHERAILTFRHVDDIGVAEGPRGGALGGGFRFDVDIGVDVGVDTVAVADGSERGHDPDESEGNAEVEGTKRGLGGEDVDVELFFAVARWFWGNRAGASGERWRGMQIGMGEGQGQGEGEGEGERYVSDWRGLLAKVGRVRDVWFGRGEVKGEEGRGVRYREGCKVEFEAQMRRNLGTTSTGAG